MLSLRTLEDTERLDRLRLIRSQNVGPITYRRLLDRFGSAAEALKALPELARRGGRKESLAICSHDHAAREMAACSKAGFSLVMSDDPLYPPLLRALEDAPPFLVVKGRTDLLASPCLAMVGARNASINGRNLARRIAADLGMAGWTVVSGMARGIDTAAHEGALASGTIAVLAGGADVIYPPENRILYERIAENGVVLSEMPLGHAPQANLFPRRNRIVSGLSLGIVVVEASLRSGSLITARLAGEQGREVFAVPGFPADPRSQGPNRLIRQGACLTENAADILEVVRPMAERGHHLGEEGQLSFEIGFSAANEDEAALRQAHAVLLKSLNSSPVLVDELVRQCQLSAAVVAVALLELDLAGRIEHHPGNRVSLVSDF